MNSGFILQGYHAKYTPFQFFDSCPESVPIVFLRLDFEGMLDDLDAPLLFEVRPFAQDLVLNAAGEQRPTLDDAEKTEKSLLGGPSAPVA
jgi:hypothetical protein